MADYVVVMTDQQQRQLVLRGTQIFHESGDGMNIQMIGRLVQNQGLGLAQESARNALTLAS